MKASSVEMMGNVIELNAEFQLVELEQRLEMAAAADPTRVMIDYCCRCVLNPLCDMYAE